MDTFNFSRGNLSVRLNCWDESQYDLRIGFDGNEVDGGGFAWRSVFPRIKGGFGTLTDDIRHFDSIHDVLIAFVAFRNEVNSILDADLARYDDAIRMVAALDPELPTLMRCRARYAAEKAVCEMAGLDALWERCLVAVSTGPANAVSSKGGRL